MTRPPWAGRDEPAMEVSAEQEHTGQESAEQGNTKQGNAEGDTLDERAEEEPAIAIATTIDWTSTPLDPPMEGSESLTLELQGFRDWKLQKLPRQYFSYKRKLGMMARRLRIVARSICQEKASNGSGDKLIIAKNNAETCILVSDCRSNSTTV